MSYPEAKYHGDAGEVSAVFRPGTAEPDLTVGSSKATYIMTGEATGGKYGLYRWDMAPNTPGATAHFHRTLSEAFFVLSGTVALYDGAKWADAVAGDFLYVPEGGIHGFRNSSADPASMLILFSPGAPREPYFQGLADRVLGKREFTPESFKEFCDAHDNLFVP
ncbi:MAG: cupin domain-containing protein [Chloroflexota bacterium]